MNVDASVEFRFPVFFSPLADKTHKIIFPATALESIVDKRIMFPLTFELRGLVDIATAGRHTLSNTSARASLASNSSFASSNGSTAMDIDSMAEARSGFDLDMTTPAQFQGPSAEKSLDSKSPATSGLPVGHNSSLSAPRLTAVDPVFAGIK